MRTHAFTLVLSYIYGLVALLDNIQLSFSSITISTPNEGLRATPAGGRQDIYILVDKPALMHTERVNDCPQHFERVLPAFEAFHFSR